MREGPPARTMSYYVTLARSSMPICVQNVCAVTTQHTCAPQKATSLCSAQGGRRGHPTGDLGVGILDTGTLREASPEIVNYFADGATHRKLPPSRCVLAQDGRFNLLVARQAFAPQAPPLPCEHEVLASHNQFSLLCFCVTRRCPRRRLHSP